MEPVAVALAVALGVAIMSRAKKSKGGPVPLSRLTESATARKYELDNNIPTRLEKRARGLAIVVGVLEDAGLRVTSMYRSPLVQAAVHYDNEQARLPPDQRVALDVFTLQPSGGAHTECRAFDLGDPRGLSPKTNAATFVQLDVDIRKLPLIQQVLEDTLNEGNHLHCECKASALEQLGSLNV